MLFLPQYGTTCVWADARGAGPSTKAAARTGSSQRPRSERARIRIGQSLGPVSVGDSERSVRILLVRAGACKPWSAARRYPPADPGRLAGENVKINRLPVSSGAGERHLAATACR